MKIFKKITLLMLAALMIIGSVPIFTSCGADEGEVLKAFKDLYAASVEVNGIIFGTELDHGEVYGHEGYAKITDKAICQSEQDIKDIVLSVYSKDYYDSSLKNLLFGVGKDSSSQTTIAAKYRTDNQGRLEMLVDGANAIVRPTGVCIIEEAKVKSTWPDVVVSVPVEFNGVRSKTLHEVTMVQESNGQWRYDTISQAGAATKDEDAVIAEAKRLCQASAQLNEIIVGAGLPYDGEYDTEDLYQLYVEVSQSAPYRTKAALDSAVKQVYSTEFYDDTIKDDLYTEGRYKEQTEGGVLLTNVCDKGNHKGKLLGHDYDFEKAVVKSLTSSEASITVTFVRDGETVEKTIHLIVENGAWKLNNYSYYVYNSPAA